MCTRLNVNDPLLITFKYLVIRSVLNINNNYELEHVTCNLGI